MESLQDYRARHAQYKLDPDLQAAHAAHPWIVIWDDHEFEDDIDSVRGHTPSVKGAMKAYFEYLPIRETPKSLNGHIYRSFKIGKLLDLIMLDTRLAGREETNVRSWNVVGNPNRTVRIHTEIHDCRSLEMNKKRGSTMN